mmetsp:Transcript_22878/g.34364  ORF Transcript_22878/g.34364 Transcript_22878/m.34364 type:complete len:128 (+) Transcript_22878:64-447(+)
MKPCAGAGSDHSLRTVFASGPRPNESNSCEQTSWCASKMCLRNPSTPFPRGMKASDGSEVPSSALLQVVSRSKLENTKASKGHEDDEDEEREEVEEAECVLSGAAPPPPPSPPPSPLSSASSGEEEG